MKKKIISAVAIALFLMVFMTAVYAQEVIDEDEFETRFASDPEALVASLETNATVVVPAPDDHECRFAILCKKVKYENGHPVSGAEVTLVSADYGIKVRYRGEWVDPPVSKTTRRWGFVCFIILWNSDPPENIEVTLKVSTESYENTEKIVLSGNLCHYTFKCIHNRIPPPPSVPELALTTPTVTSIGAVVYLWFRRRREKQSIQEC